MYESEKVELSAGTRTETIRKELKLLSTFLDRNPGKRKFTISWSVISYHKKRGFGKKVHIKIIKIMGGFRFVQRIRIVWLT